MVKQESELANPSLDSPAAQRLTFQADAMYRVHELSRLISAHFDHLVAAHGITRAQWTAIMHASQNPGSTQSELAEIMQMGRAAAGKMLDRLEEKGWIERRPDASDNRVRRVFTRNEIAPLQDVIPAAAAQLYQDFYAGMTDGEVEQFHNTLVAMVGNGRAALDKLSR